MTNILQYLKNLARSVLFFQRNPLPSGAADVTGRKQTSNRLEARSQQVGSTLATGRKQTASQGLLKGVQRGLERIKEKENRTLFSQAEEPESAGFPNTSCIKKAGRDARKPSQEAASRIPFRYFIA